MICRKLIFSSIAFISFINIFWVCMSLCSALSSQRLAGSLNEIYDEKNGLPEDWLWCLLLNGWLIFVFMAQHSLMASAIWKELLQYLRLSVISRSIFVLATSLSLQYLMNNWQGLPAPPLWFIDTQQNSALYMFFSILHITMWIVIYGASLTMDFPEMVGIKQVYYDLCEWNDPMTYKSEEVSSLYQHSRHPGLGCFLVILWVHPLMTPGRFLLSLSWTFYLLFGQSVTYEDSVYVDEQIIRKQTIKSETHSH